MELSRVISSSWNASAVEQQVFFPTSLRSIVVHRLHSLTPSPDLIEFTPPNDKMEQIALLLEPHRDNIASAASIVTFGHFLSGAVICNDIRKNKSTNGFSVVPFLGGLVITSLVVQFGVILNDLPTIRVNALGVALNIAYICFFYNYTHGAKEKTQVWLQLGYALAFVIAVIAYCALENPVVLTFRYGLLLTAILFYLVGSPLLDIPRVIREKSTAGWPVPIIISGTVISFLWLLHGIVNRENFVILQNAVIVVMSVVQLVFIARYPATAAPKAKKSSGKAQKLRNDKKKN